MIAPCTPWKVRRRPVGDWVIDQYDRVARKIRRYGPFTHQSDARAMHRDLTAPWSEVKNDL